MGNIEKTYRDLQQHLDKETLGFPATESGSDIRILKQLFPPDQAKAALYLTYKPETIEDIFVRAKNSGLSIGELERLLDECARGGVIVYRKTDGVKYYGTLHFLIGMAEGGMHGEPSPEFLKALEEYVNDGLFFGAFLNTKVSQMRTIPIEQSITTKHQIGSYDALKEVVNASEGPFAVIPCVCREGSKRADTPCVKTSRLETCMIFHDAARSAIEFGKARELTRDEALDILRKNEEDGLVLQPSNTKEIEYICSCCGCCCGILQFHKMLPDPVDHWTTNFFARVDPEACTACGVCEDTCQVDAVKVNEDQDMAMVDLKRCLGCGNCVPSCPEEAIVLEKKESEFVPPETSDDLNEIIMTNK